MRSNEGGTPRERHQAWAWEATLEAALEILIESPSRWRDTLDEGDGRTCGFQPVQPLRALLRQGENPHCAGYLDARRSYHVVGRRQPFSAACA
jgi:hypothetical protein